ncbi:hypothetical protein M408DRAFT_330514 [Serendipita vermifera MAFF 305830]|uniref:Ubinuclein middle domain-containing protein n=1 Tax=Serendipita vermifera MAFF 305830 TaxID=933852 RepID=A0A0C2WJQ5_SERVB|nr:hypothetical protein M408DRAFT_330514 [Serendipita vermifera MAFF 305830]
MSAMNSPGKGSTLKSPEKERTVIVIDDDSENEGVEAQLLQESPKDSGSSAHGRLNGHIADVKADNDPPRTPTTTAGEVPTSASVSPTPGPQTGQGHSGDPLDALHSSHDPTQKPKSAAAKAAKADSPPPQLPPKPPQQPTVRLEFFIDDPEEYEVDILSMAKASNQRLPTPPPPDKESSDSEDDDEPPELPSQAPVPLPMGLTPDETPIIRRRKRRNKDYDLDDPFLDDTELAMDQRTHVAQTTVQGFYVSAGDVALVEQASPEPTSNNSGLKRGPGRPPKRSVGPLNATLIARTLLSNPLGSHRLEDISAQSAIAASMELQVGAHDTSNILGEDIDMVNGSGIKRKRDSTPPQDSTDPNKRRKTAKIEPFHAELEAQFDVLQKAIAKHDFANKGKFPPDLKPILQETAVKAISLGEYGDNFFNYLPKIFPYNRYTMFKLTKRLVYKDHIRLIHERQAALLEELTKQVDEGMEQAKAEFDRNVLLWEERKARRKADDALKPLGPNGMEGVEPTGPVIPPPKQSANEGDHDKEGEGGDDEDDKDKPPTTRYRLNETMRGYLWALVQLSNEVCTLTNEKYVLENSKEVVSDQSQRKELYKKIMQAFPDGWMNTGTISREVSMMKKKMESATAPKPDEAPASQPPQPQ